MTGTIKNYCDSAMMPRIWHLKNNENVKVKLFNQAGIFAVTNSHWYDGQYTLTFVKVTSEGNNGIARKTVLAGQDLYTVTVDKTNSTVTLTSNTTYPGARNVVIMDLDASIIGVESP